MCVHFLLSSQQAAPGRCLNVLYVHRNRADDWAAKRADAAAQKQLKVKSTRREVFKRAEAYAKEYRSQVSCC